MVKLGYAAGWYRAPVCQGEHFGGVEGGGKEWVAGLPGVGCEGGVPCSRGDEAIQDACLEVLLPSLLAPSISPVCVGRAGGAGTAGRDMLPHCDILVAMAGGQGESDVTAGAAPWSARVGQATGEGWFRSGRGCGEGTS